MIAPMMEAASTSETVVNFYKTTGATAQKSYLQTRRRENLKCQLADQPLASQEGLCSTELVGYS
jgi:hypothetical protein